MQCYIKRLFTESLLAKLNGFPVVGLLGPRQCGKSTLAKLILASFNGIYLDLESPRDLNKLEDPELFFEANSDKLICLDEIHRAPDLFSVIRSHVDKTRRKGQFLILGSASPALLKQSAESLAGRITYQELTPLLLNELPSFSFDSHSTPLWLRGGFPDSILAPDLPQSCAWRDAFIRTLIERDIPQFGIQISSSQLRRFWLMCAHSNGQVFNASKIGRSLGLSDHTVRAYLDIFSNLFMLRILPPYFANAKKRLIKSPKIYFRDSGILHSLLHIDSEMDLFGHPAFGSSWEGFVIEQILANFPRWTPSHYRTATGVEIDLIMENGLQKIGIEIKATSSPKIGKGVIAECKALALDHLWVIAPVTNAYPIQKNVTVTSIADCLENGFYRSKPQPPNAKDAPSAPAPLASNR